MSTELMGPGRRGIIDETMPHMFTNASFRETYLFYAHLIAMCSIVMRPNLPAPAGISFVHNHYKLYINDEKFRKFSLEERMAILKHEMEHILNNHIQRLEDRNMLPWNYATDAAINQLINYEHLPKITQEDVDEYNRALSEGKVDSSKPAPKVGDVSAVLPENFPVKVEQNWTSEQYYDALKEQNFNDENNEQEKCSKCGGSGQDSQDCQDSGDKQCNCSRCKGSGQEPQKPYGPGTKQMDDHGTWEDSEGSEDMRKQLTKQMIDQAISETNKSKGNLPQNIQHYVELFSNDVQLSWRAILKNIVGNKRVNSRRTIMRSDRRFPKREDLRGKTKDRLFDLTVIVDVSGSMSDKEILTGLNEIHHICKMTRTSMKLIQVDTEVHKVEEFSENTKIFARSGMGGTRMEPAIKYIKEDRIPTDAIIFISDGYVEDISSWENQPRCKVMWLVTTEGHDVPGIDSLINHTQYHLEV